MANSAAVAALDDILASQYNNLRLDVLDTSSGHLHDGTGGRLHTSFGIGTAPSTSRGLLIDGTVTSAGTTQYGEEISPTLTSAATTAGAASFMQLVTAAAAFTMVTGSGLLIDVPTIGAASAVTTQRGIRVENQGLTGVTNAYGIYVAAQSGAATTNVGVRIDGGTPALSFLAAGAASATIHLGNGANFLSTGTEQYGIVINGDFPSSATSGGFAINAQTRTDAASYTMTNGRAYHASGPNIGAASAMTNAVGFYAANQGAAGVTNAYGAYFEATSGAATINYGAYFAGGTPAIYVAAGGVRIDGGHLAIGAATNSVDIGIDLQMDEGTGVNQWGSRLLVQGSSAATSSIRGIVADARTAAAAYTVTNLDGIYVNDATRGAGSTITTQRGIYVAAQTKGGTNNYGIYVEAPSGGSGQNVAIATATGGTVKIGGAAARATTQPTNSIDLYNGTAPAGTLTNGVTLYSAAGELTVMDAGGTATTLSPHDDDGNWVFHSWDTVKRTRLLIDVEKLLRHANRVWGLDFVHELPYVAV